MRDDQTKTFPKLRKPLGNACADRRPADPEASPDTVLAPGTRIDRYVVLYTVGTGGMGVVYAAYDHELDRKVAIKLLRSEMAPGISRTLLRREAKALARLQHSNVVTIYDVGEHEQDMFIAMEFVDGLTLREWARREKPQWRAVTDVFLRAGRGLAAAHADGLIHQDFKPANVLLARDGQVRVTDFGLAQLAAGRARTATAAPEPGSLELFGTPAYLAPERLADRHPDARSDQFSFCAALYHTLYGQLPFDAQDPDRYVEQVRSRTYHQSESTSRVPAWLRQIVYRGLSCDPRQRYRSMNELLGHLSPERRAHRRRRLLTTLGAIALFGLAIAYSRLQSRQPTPCQNAEDRLAGAWDAPRRTAVRQAFHRTGTDFAAESFRYVESVLDRRAEAWTAMHTEACKATAVHGEQSARMLDLRMHCLDARLTELRQLTSILADADAATVLEAGASVNALRSLSSCANRAELDRLNLPLLEPQERAAIDATRELVEAQFARFRLGQKIEREVVERSVETARRFGYAPLEARAYKLLSYELWEVEGEFQAQEKTLKKALRAAIAAGDRPLQVELYMDLIEAVGDNQGRFADSQLWQDFGEAALLALGPGHDELTVRLLSTIALVDIAEGELEEARGKLTKALELGERLWGADSPRLAPLLNDFSVALGPRVDEALNLQIRSLELQEKAHGRQNPKLGPHLLNLAALYALQGRYPEALQTVKRTHELLARFYGQDHWKLSYPKIVAAQVLNALDQPAAAEAYLEGIETLISRSFGEGHPMMVEALLTLAEARLLGGDSDSAAAFLEAVETVELPANHPLQGTTALWLGKAHLEAGRAAAARGFLERALAIDAAAPFGARDQLMLRTSLGSLYLAMRRPAEARSHLEQALAVGRPEAEPGLVAEARFFLAQALPPAESTRAIELARQAANDLAAGSPRTRRLAADLAVWRSSRGGDHSASSSS